MVIENYVVNIPAIRNGKIKKTIVDRTILKSIIFYTTFQKWLI